MNKLLASLAVATLGAVSSQAAVLIGWNFDGGNNTASVASSFNNSSIVLSSTISRAAGLDIAGGTNGSSAWGGFKNHTGADAAAALSANDFFEFTVAPVVSGTFQMTSLDLSVAAREGETENRTHTFTLFSNLDGYSTPIGSATTAPGTTAYQALTINTGSLAVSSSAVTYRLAATMSGTPGDFKVFWLGSTATGVNDIQINGVIPEPSTYAMIAGALALGLVAYRRRR